jgi:hypothetical protein
MPTITMVGVSFAAQPSAGAQESNAHHNHRGLVLGPGLRLQPGEAA